MTRPFALALWLLALCGAAGGLLAACSQEPAHPPPSPALWRIEGPGGQAGYLFGTAHALPDGMKWRTARLDKAFAASDTLAVEIASLDSPAEMRAVFARLAATPGQPPLAERVSPDKRELMAQAMARKGLRDADYAGMETWAVALALSQLSDRGDSANGVDRALIGAAGDKRIVELEGLERQLALFDTLPAARQSRLLEEVAADLADAKAEMEDDPRMLGWLAGDTAALEKETREGLLADPGLRDVLLVKRNLAWAERIDALIRSGAGVFVAVGAAHLVGPDGLVALLERRGYEVKRIQ